MSVAINGTNGITYNDGSLQPSAPVGNNKIINGDMRIDQRNGGASVTQSTSVAYTVDRWSCYGSVASKFTVQQNAGAIVPPSGFTNYLGITSSSAYTVGASEFFFVQQAIEGYNIANLGWGTSDAQTVTLSFYVRSSLTGTFGGTLSNGATNRVYPFTYTISSANTWEQKTVTITGDTSGTWTTNNTGGLVANFNMGAGASVSGSAGAWSGSTLRAPTGATSVVGTSGATLYITGVQLEANTTATPFENLQYTTQLQLCQRYYEYGTRNFYGSTDAPGNIVSEETYKVVKRATPTMVYGTWSWARSGATGTGSPINYQTDVNKWSCYIGAGLGFAAAFSGGSWTASSEL